MKHTRNATSASVLVWNAHMRIREGQVHRLQFPAWILPIHIDQLRL